MINKNRERERLYLELLDTFCIIISFFIAIWIRYGISFDGLYKLVYGIILLVLILSYIGIFNIFDSYSEFFKKGFFAEFISVVQLNLILALFISALLFYFKMGAMYSRIFFASFFVFNILVDYIARQYFKVFMLAYFKKSGSSSKVMVITTSKRVQSIIDKIKKEKEWASQITAIAILDKDMIGGEVRGIPIAANKDNILNVATKSVVDEVFISLPFNANTNLEEMILDFENIGITVNLSITTFNLSIMEKTVKSYGGFHVLTFSTKVFDRGMMFFKRTIDILGALVGLLITFIISLFVAPAILIESPGPLIFSQIRVGKNGRRFKIYKFRSMYRDAEARKAELLAQNEMQGLMFKMKNDPRITKVGNFIRKTSIDELPQFWNVLKGDMSLVGTRPPTEDEFLQYEGRHKRRLSLKPGITGLWQVSGRSDINNFEDVVRLDLDYIDNWSPLLDVKLLLKTVVVVFARVGAK